MLFINYIVFNILLQMCSEVVVTISVVDVWWLACGLSVLT